MATKGYRTGFCGIGLHEGTRPKSPSGKPIQVCRFWQSCTCDCHDKITQMFAIADEERVPVGNPDYEYHPPKFYMPVFGVDYGLPSIPATGTVALNGRPVEVPVVYGSDGTAGRKGALEATVLDVCTTYDIGSDQPATTKWISEQIGEKTGKTPSTGAVQAVLDRWVRIGFAIMGRKPVRFVAFTPEGESLGLEVMKAKAKRA